VPWCGLETSGNHGKYVRKYGEILKRICQWIGLRENLQETIDCTIKYRTFL
jgi:hypothetical protein